MNILDDIAQELEIAGIGTRGTTIFIDTMPAETTTGVLIRVVDPGEWDMDFDGKLRELNFQVIVRAATHQLGHSQAILVNEALTMRQKTTTNAYVYGLFPRHEPLPFGREAAGLETFVTNFEGKYRML
jgi:hypothetical protein